MSDSPDFASGRPLVLRGGTVLTMDDSHQVLLDADVLVEGDRISAVGPQLPVPDGAVEIGPREGFGGPQPTRPQPRGRPEAGEEPAAHRPRPHRPLAGRGAAAPARARGAPGRRRPNRSGFAARAGRSRGQRVLPGPVTAGAAFHPHDSRPG